MKRTTTVNFLQIENSLTEALEVCAREPSAVYAQHYHERLKGAAEALVTLTRRADEQYLKWRAAIKQRLLSGKRLWHAFERVRDELGEYGVDPRPHGRFDYWDDGLLREANAELIAFLEANADADAHERVPEGPEWIEELRALSRHLDGCEREEKRGLAEYKRVAPMRRQGIYQALSLVDEFNQVRADYLR